MRGQKSVTLDVALIKVARNLTSNEMKVLSRSKSDERFFTVAGFVATQTVNTFGLS